GSRVHHVVYVGCDCVCKPIEYCFASRGPASNPRENLRYRNVGLSRRLGGGTNRSRPEKKGGRSEPKGPRVLAGVPDMRKAECGPNKTDPVISDAIRALKGEQAPFDEDCERIFWVMSVRRAVPTGWETQVGDVPISIWQAIGTLAPW